MPELAAQNNPAADSTQVPNSTMYQRFNVITTGDLRRRLIDERHGPNETYTHELQNLEETGHSDRTITNVIRTLSLEIQRRECTTFTTLTRSLTIMTTRMPTSSRRITSGLRSNDIHEETMKAHSEMGFHATDILLRPSEYQQRGNGAIEIRDEHTSITDGRGIMAEMTSGRTIQNIASASHATKSLSMDIRLVETGPPDLENLQDGSSSFEVRGRVRLRRAREEIEAALELLRSQRQEGVPGDNAYHELDNLTTGLRPGDREDVGPCWYCQRHHRSGDCFLQRFRHSFR
jgi:hypothetical protein